MAKTVWQRYIQNSTGAVISGASVEVRVSSTGLLATIYSDDIGTPESNPFTTPASGLARFFADEGVYDITATKGLDTVTLEDEPIGNAQAKDAGTGSTNVLTVADADARYEPSVLDNPTATVDPTINDDNTAGYAYKSTWLNNTTGDFFTCADAATGAAVWIDTGVTLAGLGSVATLDTGTAAGEVRTNAQNESYFEPALGNPAATGYALTSTTGGIRSWVQSLSPSDNESITGYWTVPAPISDSGISTKKYVDDTMQQKLFVVEVSGASHTFDAATETGATLLITNTGSVTITFNSGDAVGSNCLIETDNATADVSFAGTATMRNFDGHTKMDVGEGAVVSVYSNKANTYSFTGNTAP